MTGGPRVRLGTKWPSMTSTWSWSAPAASTRAIASPSAAKSADRMLGAILMVRPYPKAVGPAKDPGRSGLRVARQPDRGEAVGAVDVGQAADDPGSVRRHREVCRGIHPPLGVVVEERSHDPVVLLRLERAGRVDETSARAGQRGGGGQDAPLLLGQTAEVRLLSVPLHVRVAPQHAQVR